MLTQSRAGAGEDMQTLRAREFGRLDALNVAYLDYAGSALYATSQLEAEQRLLASSVFGNPHADNAASRASTEVIERARAAVLRFVDADPAEYGVCFTANASAAIGLVASSYPFGPRRGLVLSADNHNSVNGIREFARRRGGRLQYIPLDGRLRLREPEAVLRRAGRDGRGGLFAFPAQSNFSGLRHPLSLIHEARALGFEVLLDAAAFVSTAPLSLRAHPADFVALSFYKIFGLPTGLGALVARRDAVERLRRPWFAGGTVRFASVALRDHELLPSLQAFEDGTPHFLGIGALQAGFDLMSRIGMPRVAQHVSSLARLMLDELLALRHRDGRSLAEVYGAGDAQWGGGVISLNLFDRGGAPIPFQRVEQRARERGVAVRGGCFCNPGAAEAALGYDPRVVRRLLSGELTPDGDSMTSAGRPIGAIRLSPGLATNAADARRAIDALASFCD